MHHSIADKKDEIAIACRRLGVMRLAVFGSAARGDDFDVDHSDADLLVRFGRRGNRDPYPDLKEKIEAILGRRVDLLDEEALDESRNYITRAAVLRDAEVIYQAAGHGA